MENNNITICFHFGGTFDAAGGHLSYLGGATAESVIEVEKLSYFEVKGHLNDHYPTESSLRLFWLKPGKESNMKDRLFMLVDDCSSQMMLQDNTVGGVVNSVIHLYVEEVVMKNDKATAATTSSEAQVSHSSERIEPSNENMQKNSCEERPEADSVEESLNRGLSKLWKVCNVLGILYAKKIAEFGSVLTEERVDEAVKFLTVTRDANFEKLKETAEKMTDAWQLCNTSIAKVQQFSWIYLIKEAEKVEEIVDWDLLSTSAVTKAEAEVKRLIHERQLKIEKKYKMKRSKLIKMIAETHLTPADFQFDPNEEVDTKNYNSKKGEIKDIIRKVKEESRKRKELVVRLEIAKNVVHNKNLPCEFQLAIIAYAEFAAQRMKQKRPMYDGCTVEEIIEELRNEANVETDAEVIEELPRTRSGRTSRR